MLHDFALSKGLLPLPVDHSLKLNDVAPSLQSRYRTFLTITRDSAPAPRFGTLTLTGRPLESLPWHRCAGSHVPHKSLKPGSRRLRAGRRLSSKQVTLRLIPD